jgi:sugar phosphate permease
VAAAVSAAALGRATRHVAPRTLLVGSLVAGAVTVLPMGRVGSFEPILALAALLGLVSGGALTLCYSMGGLVAPAASRTTAFGLFSGAALFGGALAPPAAGVLARLDLRAIYTVDAAVFLGCALLLLPGRYPTAAPEGGTGVAAAPGDPGAAVRSSA